MSEEDELDRLFTLLDAVAETTKGMTEEQLQTALDGFDKETKSRWPDGPWQNEPDDKQWIDEATGYQCWVTRDMINGHLCGYVGVPPGHPLYGSEDRSLFNVHGGVTATGPCADDDKLWLFGFDCMHAFDLVPTLALPHEFHQFGQEYRTFDFVEDECRSLADQIAATTIFNRIDKEIPEVEARIDRLLKGYDMPNPMEPPADPPGNPVNVPRVPVVPNDPTPPVAPEPS